MSSTYARRFIRDHRRGYYRRSYRPVSLPGGRAAGMTAAAVVVLAAVAVPHAHHRAAVPAARAAAPRVSVPAGPHAPASWAAAFLAAAGEPVTACNTRLVVAWQHAEGSNPAWRNPLDTTWPEPGSHPVNRDGVQAYRTWRAGLAASAATIRNGLYGPVLAALAGGHDARRAATAIAVSPWGTQTFNVSC